MSHKVTHFLNNNVVFDIKQSYKIELKKEKNMKRKYQLKSYNKISY